VDGTNEALGEGEAKTDCHRLPNPWCPRQLPNRVVHHTIDGDATPHGLAQRERWRFRREVGWTPEKRVSVNNDGEEKGEEKHKTVVKIAWDLRKSILALTEYYSSRIRFKYI
jgi:hypothetical protein